MSPRLSGASIERMYVVALTRWGPPGQPPGPPAPDVLAAEVSALGPLLGSGAYELRLALSAALPVVLLETPAPERAKALLASVRGRGHGAVACESASVLSSASMAQPKTFELGPDALTFESPGVARASLSYAEVLALLVATHAREEESTREQREKKLSLGRAVLSGGLVRSKTSVVTERQTTQESERVLYVFSRSGVGHALLRETRLHYTGLGTRMGLSSVESFTTLLALLRERAPQARFDDRLLKPRAGGSLSVSRTHASRTVSTSNDREVDLAAHLLTMAFFQGQA